MEMNMLSARDYTLARSAILSNKKDYDSICRSIDGKGIRGISETAMLFIPLARKVCLSKSSVPSVAMAIYMIYSGRSEEKKVARNPSYASQNISREEINKTKRTMFSGSPFERNGSTRPATEKDVYTYITSVIAVSPETSEKKLLSSLRSLGYAKTKEDEVKYLSFYKKNRER